MPTTRCWSRRGAMERPVDLSRQRQGDWVKYFADTLKAIGAANCDSITLHTYTHGTDPALIRWRQRWRRNFGIGVFTSTPTTIYRSHPPGNTRLPVYIAETDRR